MPKIVNPAVTAFTIKDVDRDFANRFRAACQLNGRQYRDVLLQLMEQYTRENLPSSGKADKGPTSTKK